MEAMQGGRYVHRGERTMRLRPLESTEEIMLRVRNGEMNDETVPAKPHEIYVYKDISYGHSNGGYGSFGFWVLEGIDFMDELSKVVELGIQKKMED